MVHVAGGDDPRRQLEHMRACLLIVDAVVDHHGGQEDSAAGGERVFVVAGGDSAPLLQAGVSAFDGVAVAVDERVERRWTSTGRAFLLAAADLIRALGDGGPRPDQE